MHIQLKTLKPYVILLVILLIAYLPVSTFYFGMKNDAFSDNFPNKFFLSEALHTGHLPLWNPYMNFGFPIYADMGFAFYNPITWLFGLIGYNAYTLTIEVLLYIYLGGVFMYRLGRYLQFNSDVCIAIAAMYMCSGFYTGSLQYINFLTAAGFLPLVMQTFLRLINNPGIKASFVFAVACYFVFAGGHPAIPVALLYFLFAILILLFGFNRAYRQNSKNILVFLFAAVVCFMLLYLPAIYSYLFILGDYGRSSTENQSLYATAGFTFSSYISFLFPYSTITVKDWFGTDVAMRNGFFSIAGFICAMLSFKSKQLYAKVFFIAAVIMLLLSAGGEIKALVFSKLPLLNYIRYNGEFRIYSILCFCIAAGYGLQQLNTADAGFKKTFNLSLKILGIICVSIFIILVAGKYFSISEVINVFGSNTGGAAKIKQFLAGPFSWFLMVSIILASAVILLSLYALKRNNFRLLVIIIILDLVVNSILYLPVTGVGQVTLKSIQAIYNTSPQGMPPPPLTPVNKIDTLDGKTTGLVGDITYYNKLIGTARLTDYPSYFTSTDQYFADKDLVREVSKHAYFFIKHTDTILGPSNISVLSFSPQRIEAQVNTMQDDTLVLLQNNYRFWRATVNGNSTSIQTVYKTFMSVPIRKGMNEVVFEYIDKRLPVCICISLLSFITGIIIVTRKRLPVNNQG